MTSSFSHFWESGMKLTSPLINPSHSQYKEQQLSPCLRSSPVAGWTNSCIVCKWSMQGHSALSETSSVVLLAQAAPTMMNHLPSVILLIETEILAM